MARTFVRASSQALTYASAIASVPFSVSMWLKMTDLSAAVVHYPFAMEASGPIRGFFIQVFGNGSGLPQGTIRVRATDGGTNGNAVAGTVLSVGTWYHVVGVWASGTSRSIYLDGVKVTDTASSVGSATETNFGRLNATGDYSDLSIAFPAVYSGALTDADVAQLAMGYSPRRIKQTLLAFWPLSNSASPEPGGTASAPLASLTLVGTPTKTENPRIIY